MAWHRIYTLEDKCPGHICYLTNNLRVHQVAQTNETGCYTRSNSNIVEYHPNAELGLLDIKPKGNHQTEGTTMRCQALITSKLHTAILQEVNGQQHLYKALF